MNVLSKYFFISHHYVRKAGSEKNVAQEILVFLLVAICSNKNGYGNLSRETCLGLNKGWASLQKLLFVTRGFRNYNLYGIIISLIFCYNSLWSR